MRTVLLTVACLGLGCADSHVITRAGGYKVYRLHRENTVLVVTPKNGVYGTKTYRDSGRLTARALAGAFSRRAGRVDTLETPATPREAMKVARERNVSVLIYPEILWWEDRATEWSVKPDRVEVKVQVVWVHSQTELDNVVIEGTSGIATFGGDHPQDLLKTPMREWVDGLYR